MNVAALPDALLEDFRSIVGDAGLLHREVDLNLYAYDAAVDRAMPSAVVFPETAAQISALVKLCRKNGLPFVARGAGTNLCGCTIPLGGGVVIAPTRMKRLLELNTERRTALVEPGMPNLFLKQALAPHGLYYAPDPASQKACTIGGNIGTNAGGPHCLKYGVTSRHVLGLEVVLPDGEIAEFNLNQPGPDLTGFWVGSEGTLGIVTRATLNLLPIPPRVETMLVSFPSLDAAMQTVTDIIKDGILPATLEALDKTTVHAVEAFTHAGYPLDAEAVLLIEVDGSDELTGHVNEIRRLCKQNGCGEFRLAQNDREREKLWEGRRGSYPAMARLAPNVLVEDGVVPRNRLPEAARRIRAIADENGLKLSLIFHAGDGNLHPQILFDERDPDETRKVREAGRAMLKACVDLGGSISGEHGIGMDKRDAMRWLFTPQTLSVFRRLKNAMDPGNLCNPDKLIPLADEVPAPRHAVQIKEFMEPETAGELADVLTELSKRGSKARVEGRGTRGVPEKPGTTLSTRKLNRLVEHDVDNFTVTVQTGMMVTDLQKALAAKNQKTYLPFVGTVGGTLAVNAPQEPRLRDQVLGLKAVLSDGTEAAFGGKVVKNVAGYDAAKLFLGSRGTLGVMTEVTLRTFPLHYPGEAVPLKGAQFAPTDAALAASVATLGRDGKATGPAAETALERIRVALDPAGVFKA